MPADPALDFASLLFGNLAGFTFFAMLGALAGAAFPVGLLCRRALAAPGPVRARSQRQRRRLMLVAVLAACAAMPWAALWLGRWHDGAPIEAAHALVLIAGSGGSMACLLRRWRLRGV